MRFPFLYEINTRCWLAELSERMGRRVTLADVPEEEITSWKRCGFTHIWLMGVWSLGKRGLAWSRRCFRGRENENGCSELAGSPYAIVGYDAARSLGGDSGLQRFRRRLNEHGLKLVLDFVPNHTALDHPWVKSHPDFYIRSNRARRGAVKPFRGATDSFMHGDCGHGSPWVDTLQLNYSNPLLREAMIAELLHVAERCDGVRCDMAMLVLNDVFARTWRGLVPPDEAIPSEFWSDAINAVRNRHSDFLFIAEVYWDLEERLQQLGFDYTYDKRLYDRMIARDGAGVVSSLLQQSVQFIERSAHFLENHDEPRIAALMEPSQHHAAALLICALPGMRFIHEGQAHGARVHANVHFSRRPPEAPDSAMQRFYCNLFDALSITAVGRGEWQLLQPVPAWEGNDSQQTVALIEWRTGQGSADLAVVNMAPHRAQCFAPVSFANEQAEERWLLRDLLGNEIHVRSAAELLKRGLFLDVPAYAAQLFHCEIMRD